MTIEMKRVERQMESEREKERASVSERMKRLRERAMKCKEI